MSLTCRRIPGPHAFLVNVEKLGVAWGQSYSTPVLDIVEGGAGATPQTLIHTHIATISYKSLLVCKVTGACAPLSAGEDDRAFSRM